MNQKQNLDQSSLDASIDSTNTGHQEIINDLTEHYDYIREHELFVWELASCLDGFVELNITSKKWLIWYILWSDKLASDLYNIIEDIKDQVNDGRYRIPSKEEVMYFEKKFSDIEIYAMQNKNNPEAPSIDKFTLYNVDLDFDVLNRKDIVTFLDLSLWDIIKPSQLYQIISELCEDIEYHKYKTNPNFKLKVSLSYNTRELEISLFKKIKDTKIDQTEHFMTKKLKTPLEKVVDLIINIRWWETVDQILNEPNKSIDLIDGILAMECRAELDLDLDEDDG